MSDSRPQHVPKPSVSQVDERRHRKRVLESQLDLLREGIFSDMTFIVGPSQERIPCHQLFLKSRSPVFQVMFSEHWNHNKEIPLEDVDPKIFTKFLEFIYADKFEADVPEALGLLQVAHKYDVQLLVDNCEKMLESKATIIDAVDVFQAARKYGKTQLMEKSLSLMLKSLPQLQRLPSFSRVDKETLTFILKRNDLDMKEVDLFRLALQWGKNQCGFTAQESLQDILPHIRFPVMTLEEFTKTVVPAGLLSQSQVIQLFTYFGSDAETKKSLAGTLGFSTQRRNSSDSIVSVRIYNGDYESKLVKYLEYKGLRGCLQFYIQPDPMESSAKFSRLVCDDEETAIGLKGISVYCPAWQGRYYERFFTKFKILLRAKYCCDGKYDPYEAWYEGQNYQELLAMSPVELEEGKVTDIKFGTVIPVRRRTLYCIKVEETISNAPGTYRAKDFGGMASNVYVKIDDKCQAVLNIWRIKDEFGLVSYPYPQMICKLSFQEL